MIIFRPHRGNLADAMSEAKEFKNVEQMKEYIVQLWKGKWHGENVLFTKEDIDISDDAFNDSRIGWEDSRKVCIKRMGEENYIELYGVPQCIGMCATRYNKYSRTAKMKKNCI